LIAPEPVQEPLSQIALLKFDQSVRFAIVSALANPFRCPWRPDGLFRSVIRRMPRQMKLSRGWNPSPDV